MHRSFLRLAAALALTTLSAPITCTAAPADPGHKAIEEVVERFRTAIIDKDRPRFLSLFLPDSPVIWQASTEDASLARLRQKRPQMMKVKVSAANNYVSFIDSIVADDKRNEETFANLRIDSDGDIGSVSFDYVYLRDGVASNHGRENWALVRTEQGWKIV
ncbi:MAG: nuclear transport factor 2 family protein, partial [Lysobacter sp.]